MAYIITSEREAIEIALQLAEEFAQGSAERDRDRKLQAHKIIGFGGMQLIREIQI